MGHQTVHLEEGEGVPINELIVFVTDIFCRVFRPIGPIPKSTNHFQF